MNITTIVWILAAACLLRVSRLLTNRSLLQWQPVAAWVSALNLAGTITFVVLLGSCLLRGAWLEVGIVAASYFVANLGRSRLAELSRNPQIVYIAAVQQATQELESMPQGSEKLAAVTARADEIMRSQGYSKNDPQGQRRNDPGR